MNHGIVDIFAFQEALLIEAILGVALLTMIWVGFRRWLQYKERMSRLTAEQTAEHAAQFGAQIDRVEARLNAIETMVTDARVQPTARIDPIAPNPLSKPDEIQPNP